MSGRAVAAAQQRAGAHSAVRAAVVATSGGNAADQIERANSLLDSGAITQDELTR